uniref:Dynein axonemal intermediate chain 4 n=1 Tax=Electrophorus electricus TaxID=8005 RepID=A0A4W4G6K8_ELEEL
MPVRTAKQMKPTLKVTKSRTPNQSTSGVLRVNQSATNTRSVNSSVHRKSFTLAGDSKVLDKGSVQTHKQTVQVFDETGKDVTPQPLYQPEAGALQPKQSKIFTNHDTSGSTLSDFLSTAYQTTNASFAAPFTRSVFGSSSVSRSSQSTMESMNDEIEDPSSKKDISLSLSDVQVRREEIKEQIKEHMLDCMVDCYLTETETIWLLDMPALSVSMDSEEAEVVKSEGRNMAYQELCKNRLGNDKYMERPMQTFNGAPKAKEVQSDSISMVEKATMATHWDIYDSYVSDGGAGNAADGASPTKLDISTLHRVHSSRPLDRTMSGASAISTASTSSSRIDTEAFVVQGENESDPEDVLHSEKFLQDLLVMERAVLENIYQPKLAAYRQLPILPDPNREQKAGDERDGQDDVSLNPALERLWAFNCELTMGRNVSNMAWNKKNPDLLAVGYGQFDFKDQKSGLVCCWSLKNPTWPERIFHCESGVTALDFSTCSPSQLAVGMHDGSIAIYNVQSTEKTPVIDSSDCAHKHTGPVWQVRWVENEHGPGGEDKRETLISVSADGRISKWFLRKGLDVKERKIEDSNIYLVGTEDGLIHKCSCSYNEQFLGTYTAHIGPVYKITWSPLCPDVFLSCSADWTIQLWRQDLFTPILGFTSTHKAVHDIEWSPRWATVFGAVNEGRLEIWDLGSSILDPIIVSMARPGVKLTSLLFATQTDCVLVGDSGGQVSVYKLKNLNAGEGKEVNTLHDIIRSTLASQL